MFSSLLSLAATALAVSSVSAQTVQQISDGQLQVPKASTVTVTAACSSVGSSSALPSASASGLASMQDKHGAVASESAVCSRIGIDLLKAGGNAADAMVGTVLCIGVIAMYHSGYVS